MSAEMALMKVTEFVRTHKINPQTGQIEACKPQLNKPLNIRSAKMAQAVKKAPAKKQVVKKALAKASVAVKKAAEVKKDVAKATAKKVVKKVATVAKKAVVAKAKTVVKKAVKSAISKRK